jgi:ketosteroid isomerase-like protein
LGSAALDLVRRFYELLERGDWSRLELLSEDLVYRPIREITETGEYRGRDGFRRYMDEFFQTEWADGLKVEATSYREYGDAVVVRVHLAGHGRASGLDFSARVFQVFAVRDGEIARIEDFLDRAEALTAAGAPAD